MNKRVKVSPDKYFLKADIAVYALIVAFICLSCSVFYFFKKQDEQGFEAVYRGQTVLTMYFDAPEKYEVAEKFSSDVSVTAEDGEYAFKITLENGKYINE